LDALAALVPAEVLGAHAGVISYLTKTENKVVTITYPDWLFAAFCGFVILSLLLYALPRYFGGRWDHWRDWIRMLIPAAAFVGWTMLQPMSAFDAVSSLPQGPRAACAILLALFLGLIATLLAYELDKKNPESRQSSA
jgi:hypothetical protein